MGEVHPEIVAEHAEVFGIVGDESATNVRCAVFLHAPEEFEQLRRLEMFEQMTAINAVALAQDFPRLLAPQKLEDVALEIFDAELFAGRDRFGVAFDADSGDSVFF